jgi:3-hydroxyacyl-[acyl-carrier-protein] dehydratase
VDDKALTLGINGILQRIPHRAPVLLIDRVLVLEPGRRGIGIKCVSYNEPFFPGHFPSEPIFPGALLMESMAQMAAIVLRQELAEDGGASGAQVPVFLAEVRRLRYLRKVVPGDRLEIEIKVDRRFGHLVQVTAWARVEGEEAAHGELTLAT